MAKIGLSANSSTIISIYVSGKMVRKIVLNLSNLQTCSPNIKTIVYRDQQQQLTTLMEACGSVDDSSQQTVTKTLPCSGGAAAVIGHHSEVSTDLSVNAASKGAWFRGGNCS